MKRYLSGLRIINFRGLKSFACDSFRPITIIGGKNNCGKSTLLEAICFVANRTDGAIPGKLTWNRGEKMKNHSLSSLFYGDDDHGEIMIHGLFSDKTTRGVNLECTHRSAVDFNLEDSPSGGINDKLPFTYVQQYYTNEGGDAVSRGIMMVAFIKDEYRVFPLMPKAENSQVGRNNEPADAWRCMYYQTQRKMDFSTIYAKLFESGSEKKLLPYLKAVDSRILDIAYDGKRLLASVENGKMRLPLNVMGDGVVKVVEILSILAIGPENGILCVDEIENGLHHSVMKTVWNALVCLARERNIQVVMTTHNIELLKSIGEETGCEDVDDFVYLNVVRHDDDEVIAFPYDHSELAHSLSMNMEVR